MAGSLPAPALPEGVPDALQGWSAFTPPSPEAMWAQFQADLPQVLLFSAGIALYGIVVFHFYRFLARRDLFRRRHFSGHGLGTAFLNLVGGLWYLVKYVVLFPLVTFVLFAVFSLFLLFLAKERSLDELLLVSITMVAATRIAAYYHEALAQDLAKLVPLALLGVFLVQPNFFSLELVLQRIAQLPAFAAKIPGFLFFTLALEVLLRLLLGLKRLLLGHGKKKPATASALDDRER